MTNGSIQSLCVFCGSSPGKDGLYSAAARALGTEVARRGLRLVYGGGRVGLMGSVADAALSAGGEVVGVMTRHLVEREIAHRSLSALHIVETMHERKQRMAELGDAYVLLPGGFGSWEEFCEVVTWLQLGLHQKPCGILNVRGYYAPLAAMIHCAVEEGFIRDSHRDALLFAEKPGELLDGLFRSSRVLEPKWSDAKQPT